MTTAAPWIIRHIDLSIAPQPALTGAEAAAVYTLFWWKHRALGARIYLREELPQSAAQLAQEFAHHAAPVVATLICGDNPCIEAGPDRTTVAKVPVAALREADMAGVLGRISVPEPADAGDVSVIVCTRKRPHELAKCLSALQNQQAPPREIIVVDNCSTPDTRVQQIVAGSERAVYLHEARPGLSTARNSGVRASRGALIAFTDDDVLPHERWTCELVRAFAERRIDAVTGLVLPAALDTEAQILFETGAGFSAAGWLPVLYAQAFSETARDTAMPVWNIGAGANMAFRRSVFERLGLFDERLGAGASGCSEDSELWYRILAAGGCCLYQPLAVVFHHHRRELTALQRQMYAYSKGHASALVAQYDRHRHGGNLHRLLLRLPRYYLRLALSAWFRKTHPHHHLIRYEIAGWLAGCGYLFRPGWRRRRSLPALKQPSQ